MTTHTASRSLDAIGLASEIVAAYVSNNAVRTADLPEFIASVHAAIIGQRRHLRRGYARGGGGTPECGADP